MIYEQFLPKNELTEIIKSFWYVDSEGNTSVQREKIIPDGYPELIFHYGDPYRININGTWEQQSMYIIAGQIKNYFYLENTGTSKMFAIKFQPWALKELFGIDMFLITDKVVKIPNEVADTLKEVITIATGVSLCKDKVTQIENWFSKYLINNQLAFSEKRKAVTSMIEKRGNIQLKQLQEEFRISERALERYFKSYIGLSPKFYARIIRFSYIFQWVQNESIDWADIVYNAGYYDQSHFIKNFKEFTGEDPGKYGFSSENMANFFLKK